MIAEKSAGSRIRFLPATDAVAAGATLFPILLLLVPGLEALQYLLDSDKSPVAALRLYEFEACHQARMGQREAVKVQMCHLQPKTFLKSRLGYATSTV